MAGMGVLIAAGNLILAEADNWMLAAGVALWGAHMALTRASSPA